MNQNQARNDGAQFQNQPFANLISFRRNGQPVTTPMWFAQEGATLYMSTGASAGKIKRIRNNGLVQIGPSDRRGKPLGPIMNAQARIITGSEAQHANALLDAKYGWQRTLVSFLSRFRRHMGDWAYLAITPVTDQ